ncbi:hypothetical protein [Kordiimonas sp.]|uniref:hypothetical protein n=1 Tax=Kordiimonas sp. TaxID=1970157 RepID=UPI003A910822
MSNGKSVSPAQMIDSFLRRVVLGVFIVALKYAGSALEVVSSEDMAGYLDTAQLVASILAVVIVLPAFLKFFRARSLPECRRAESDSYISEMVKQSGLHAFSGTFIFLVALEVAVKKFAFDAPISFFLDIVLFVALTIFSISFYLLVRDDGTEDLDDWEQGE